MTFYLYTPEGKRVTVEEAANLRAKRYDQIGVILANRPSTTSKRNSPLLSHHPWELESQRFLARGGRSVTTPIQRKPKRIIQSAGSRLLTELQEDQDRRDFDPDQSDLGPTDMDKLYDYGDLEFEATSLRSSRRSTLCDLPRNNQESELTGRLSLGNSPEDGGQSCSLKMTMATVMQKMADNEGMGISTFTYLTEERGEDEDLKRSHSTKTVHMSGTKGAVENGLVDEEEQDDEFDSDDEVDYLPSSRSPSPTGIRRVNKSPVEILRQIFSVGLLLRATLHIIRPIYEEREQKLRQGKAQTFIELRKEIEIQCAAQGLNFDKYAFKFTREKCLTKEASRILMMPRQYRTETMLKSAMVAVTATTEAFSEFPMTMQNAIISKAWYEKFGERRMIIRQGQAPLNFYFIISGSAIVSVTRKHKETGQPFEETVAILKAGQSFGELALIYGGKRSATIVCNTPMELLVMSRNEFTQIFLNNAEGQEAEHIAFLRTIPFIPKEVVDQLNVADNSVLLFTYFRRQMTICMNSNQNDWIYIIRSGQCRIIKEISLERNAYLLMENLPYSKKMSRPVTSTEFYRKSFSSPNHNPTGLESIVFEPFGGTSSVSLISDGAECVAINKRFFMKHCPTVFLNWLRRKVQPFPKVEDLEHKLEVFWDWQRYRRNLVQKCIF